MAEPNTGPFEETELDIITTAQAVTCVDDDDVTSKAPGRLLHLTLSPIAEHEHEPGQPWHQHITASSASPPATTTAKQSTDSSYSLCSVDKYSSSSSPLSSPSAESYTSTAHPPDIGDDCAGFVLACLFCRFYDLCLMLPNSCEWAAQRLCPAYRNFAKNSEAARNNGSGNSDCNCNCDFDCGLFDACHETGECLELAMEISEVCYR